MILIVWLTKKHLSCFANRIIDAFTFPVKLFALNTVQHGTNNVKTKQRSLKTKAALSFIFRRASSQICSHIKANMWRPDGVKECHYGNVNIV